MARAALALGLWLALAPLGPGGGADLDPAGAGPDSFVTALSVELDGAAMDALRSAKAAAVQRAVTSEALSEGDGEPGVEQRGEADAGAGAVPVRVALLKAFSPRLESGGWPLSVRVKGRNHLFGMRRFALRAPAVGGYQADLIVLEHLRREGVLAARSRLAGLRINAEGAGLVKLVEHPQKSAIEAQRRRDGAILRFELADSAQPPAAAESPDRFRARRLVIDVEAHGDKAHRYAEDAGVAEELFSAYVHGSLPAAEVFDLDATARFFAVVELWRSVEALRAPHLRLYFNPVTQRLEPIGRAVDPASRYLEDTLVTEREAWSALLLRDPELRARTREELVRMSDEMASGETARWVRAFERPLVEALRADQPDLTSLEFAPLEARAARIATLLREGGALASSASVATPGAGARAQDALVDFTPAHLRELAPPRRANPVPRASLDEVLERHSFLRFDAEANALQVAPGEWKVEGNLVLPDSVGLRAGPGTTLRFERDALLLASGPLELLGSAEAPIALEGRRSKKGKRRTWQGVVSLRSPRPHRWRHVKVRDTTGIAQESWRLTGGVTLREAEVQISDSSFRDNRGEDALNLIHSRFRLTRVELRNSASDAFDGDFSDGRVADSVFAEIGGDAIDVSGADVDVEGVRIEDVRDKAISVGEGSRLRAVHIDVEGVGTGVASKDGSHASIERSRLARVEHAALMAYTKKPQYGPAELEARALTLEEVGSVVRVQTGSRVRIDGREQPTEDLDVEVLYEHGHMKK